MPRVEMNTDVRENEPLAPAPVSNILRIRPEDLIVPEVSDARPGPEPTNEKRKIESLAQSIKEIGQLVPAIVEPMPGTAQYRVIDGRRRALAARLLWQPLDCIVYAGGDTLAAAVHANIKRRSLTALQFAYLCKTLREWNGWSEATDTKHLAKYLGVSEATVRQHEKILRKPEAMEQEAYDAILLKLREGQMAADTAFELLTHVEPTRVQEVLPRAQEIANQEADRKASRKASRPTRVPSTTGKGGKTPPAVQESRREASQKGPETPKTASEPTPPAAIQRKHVKQAATEQAATSHTTVRTIPELRRLFDALKSAAYPDTMRSFISLLAEEWWRGDCGQREVLNHWSEIAKLVREAELLVTGRFVREAEAKRTQPVRSPRVHRKAS
jgi:ParB/RepB/Spo0J family partition protein